MKFLKRELSVLALKKLSLLPYKSSAVALLFTLFCGPIGLLYASLWGGVLMSIVGIVVLGSGMHGPMILFWLICNIWGAFAVQLYNNKIITAKIKLNYEENHYTTSVAG